MHSSPLTTAMLLVAAASIQAAPQVSDVSTTTTVGPTVLTGDKMGAAVFLDGYSGTTVVYQAADTSVHALTGSGPPSTSSSYAASVLLSAGIARNDTPLALAVDNQLGFTLEHLFYLSTAACPGGNYLHEYYNPPYRGWTNGPLNSLEICSSNTSNFLYAVGGARSGLSETSSPIRVGYMRANDDTLCEANDQSSGTWTTAQF